MTTSRARRLALAVIVLALLAGGLVLGHDHVSEPADAVLVATEVPAMPVATPAGALTASWYCPGVRAPADGSATGVVSVLNPSDSIVKATLTVVPSVGVPIARAIEVKERSRLDVNLASVAAAPYAAALVEIVGSAGVVEQSETSASGSQSGPCAVGASPSWFFADGATTVDASYVLLAFNPFPDDAIVDFSFATEEGTRTPQPLQGFVIPARSLRVIDVGSQVQRNTQVSLSAVGRAGRFVLGRQQRYSGARKGVVASLATPSPGTAWWFPDVDKGAGSQQRFAIYNPGKVDQQVTLSLFPAAGAVVPDAVDPSTTTTSGDTSTTSASTTTAPTSAPSSTIDQPIVATVSAGSSVIVDLAQNPSVPAGRYSASLTADGPGVVIEQVIDVTASGRSGTSSMLGSRYTSESWLVVGSPVGGADVVTIANATGVPNTITVATLGPAGSTPVPGFTSLVIPPAGLVQIDLVALAIAGKPLTVTGSTDLVVSRTTTASKVGLSVSLGIPSGHLTVPAGAAADDGTAGTGTGTDTATSEPSVTSESPTTSG